MQVQNNIEFDKIIFGAAIMMPSPQYGETWPPFPQKNLALGLKDGKIAKIFDESDVSNFNAQQKIRLDGGIITPGFIDTQVNGGGGVLFNEDTSEDGVKTIFDAHYYHGTIGILPTLITDSIEKVTPAINAVRNLITQGHEGILGIHLEGPFLSPDKKGIHQKEFFNVPDSKIVEIYCALKIAPTLITLAPDMVPPHIIAEFDNQPYVILSAGHTNANAHQINEAVENGLRGVTHLFNAMSQLSAREPGLVGYVLEKRNLLCGIIADLQHVAAQNLRLAYDVLGARNLLLVSDAMPPSGTNATEFSLQGKTIFVRDFACFDENGTLAGSALTMSEAVKIMHHKVQIPIGSVLQMASETPAALIHQHQRIGAIREGYEAKLIHLDDELNFLGHI